MTLALFSDNVILLLFQNSSNKSLSNRDCVGISLKRINLDYQRIVRIVNYCEEIPDKR